MTAKPPPTAKPTTVEFRFVAVGVTGLLVELAEPVVPISAVFVIVTVAVVLLLGDPVVLALMWLQTSRVENEPPKHCQPD
jgi:hypothetical protein